MTSDWLWWLIPLLFVLLGVDRWMSTLTGAVPIYRSKAVGAGIVTGVIVGLYLLHSAG